ncbi:MAG: hypothetical protein J7496_06925 [Novosphingobium sp.]|nr:hypothetical protein [Novosphingobium sp.]MBO9602225.1 hypothetical protein [Novosphingobium sp.]
MSGAGAAGTFPRVGLSIAASILLGSYALAAWGSGFDRMSNVSPALERLVPAPFRAQADRSAATIALLRGDMAAASSDATAAVLEDPLDPLSNSLLGSALASRNDPRGEEAFRIAAARGWRDRLTQLYWYGIALESGDAERAALRADALLRTDPYSTTGSALLEPLEASPAGRAALAHRLASNPGWARPYLAGETDAGELRLKSGIALLAARQGNAMDCDTPRPLVGSLLAQGMRSEAESLWRAACGDKDLAGIPPGGLVDGGFERFAAADPGSAPFGWRGQASGDVTVEPVARGDGKALILRNTASVSRLVLSQPLALAPGGYRVRANIRPGSGSAEGGVAFSLDCGARPRRPATTAGDPAGSGQALTAGSCAGQVLGLWLRPGSDITLDDVTIVKAGTGKTG